MELDKMKALFTEVIEFYKNLQDTQSKEIFKFKLLFNITGEWKYILDMFNLPELKNFGINEYIQLIYNIQKANITGKEVILYACGLAAKDIINTLKALDMHKEVRISCFCDKDEEKQKDGFYGFKVISPQELYKNYSDAYIIVGTTKYSKEIKNDLILNGFKEENIWDKLDEVVFKQKDNQYFEGIIVAPGVDEVFIDGGAFDGATSMKFIKWCNNNYKKIYIFEAASSAQVKCKEMVKGIENVQVIEAGLWSETKELCFNDNNNAGSSIIENGNCKIKVTSIDEVLNNEKATFIKLDIEGAELEALKGAKNTIIKYKPKLAICIYHKPEDIISIPLYIQSLVPEYKFYIRHYCDRIEETVLYAI